MGKVIVSVSHLGVSYDPSNIVYRGDVVEFRVEGVAGTVLINFDNDKTCLTAPNPMQFNPTALAPFASEDSTVESSAKAGPYPFTASLPSPPTLPEGQKIGSNLETKTGSLEVATDPMEEGRKKP